MAYVGLRVLFGTKISLRQFERQYFLTKFRLESLEGFNGFWAKEALHHHAIAPMPMVCMPTL